MKTSCLIENELTEKKNLWFQIKQFLNITTKKINKICDAGTHYDKPAHYTDNNLCRI